MDPRSAAVTAATVAAPRTLTEHLDVLAVPFERPALIREVLDGRPTLYREIIDPGTFPTLPPRVPFLRHHNRAQPMGWARPKTTGDGITAVVELLDTSAARDALEEVRGHLVREAADHGLEVGEPHRAGISSCHPERSEGGHARYGPLHFVQGDRSPTRSAT